MLFQGTLPDLQVFQQKGSKLLLSTSDNEAAIRLLQEYDPERTGDTIVVPFHDKKQIAAIQRTLTENNVDVYLLRPQENGLEQLFIDLTTTQ
jgi:ABC-2 type transport system ATP-binding protein